jgi:hypothetical protein
MELAPKFGFNSNLIWNLVILKTAQAPVLFLIIHSQLVPFSEIILIKDLLPMMTLDLLGIRDSNRSGVK